MVSSPSPSWKGGSGWAVMCKLLVLRHLRLGPKPGVPLTSPVVDGRRVAA